MKHVAVDANPQVIDELGRHLDRDAPGVAALDRHLPLAVDVDLVEIGVVIGPRGELAGKIRQLRPSESQPEPNPEDQSGDASNHADDDPLAVPHDPDSPLDSTKYGSRSFGCMPSIRIVRNRRGNSSRTNSSRNCSTIRFFASAATK